MCRKFRLAHFLIVLLLLGSSFAHAQDAKSQIAAEIARLQRLLAKRSRHRSGSRSRRCIGFYGTLLGLHNQVEKELSTS